MKTRSLAYAISVALISVAAGCSTATRPIAANSTSGPSDSERSADKPQVVAVDELGKAKEDDGRKRSDVRTTGRLEAKDRDALAAQAAASGQPKSVEEQRSSPPAEPMKLADLKSEVAQNAAAPVGSAAIAPATIAAPSMPTLAPPAPPANGQYWEPSNRENYADHQDNAVMRVAETPVSTFSIDVDTGSYSNVRRMIQQGALPPTDAVRAEEFINYFDYGYTPPPSLKTPFSVTTEVAAAPWNAEHKLLLVGIKGYEIPKAEIPASNLVFLIDTSGSMQSPDKIELLKTSFKQMATQLRAQDHVSIVVYAGSAGLILPPTAGNEHEKIIAALDALAAGGSTNGAAGIELAYQMAQKSFVPGGVNRVILATDGDFNVGTVDITALKTLVAEKRKSGIALTTLGFGQGNYNDETAEQLADVGNGNHFYIDTESEGRKVLVDELASTTMTIAKDVKIQIEFNPQVVAEYRLIGYENRVLRREDFNNDKIDAGEIGAGHDVTALYELTLVGSRSTQIDPLRYDSKTAARGPDGRELAFLKLRYKQPDSDTSTLIERPIKSSEIAATASPRMAFAAAVGAYADLLRGGTHLGSFGYGEVANLAQRGLDEDRSGYRHEFVELLRKSQALSTPATVAAQISR